MAKPKKDQYEIDPVDGLKRGVIGAWGVEDKHERMQKYIFASHAARRKFWREYGKETGFVDLYCGPGRARIRETNVVADGSAVVAAKRSEACTPFQRYVIADIDKELLAACESRLRAVGVSNICALCGPAEETVRPAINALHKGGLNLAFIDPFNANLPFSVIETLGELNRMDQLIHFSVMDYRRNLSTMMQDGRLDSLAPGWQKVVSKTMGVDEQRNAVFFHWKGLLESKLRYKVSDTIVRVRGPNRAEIYWLVFASRHDLGGKLWREIANLGPQRGLI
ncbi:three-Cys-motif partner protein [Pseudoxanthomonas sp. 3HH-4]|uniref:three-Cys-motif partner protein TcmP n=1 Tax=Pseudoxanthomonas sp. 3HH-4 TaxID=1690214 RepID=UPI00114F2581|nr:three-Cys-motif partner protein TcmP [Pseudoxanthomonas sp. 3HH-4]TQM17028.1 three-Cys-motif partner protein [Pseudoxanthomonas sp. 3HH-4]